MLHEHETPFFESLENGVLTYIIILFCLEL